MRVYQVTLATAVLVLVGTDVALAQDVVLSGTVKNLKGQPLTTTVLNQGLKDAGQRIELSDEQFRMQFSISASPRGGNRFTSGTFDPTTGKYEIRLQLADLQNERVDVTLSAAGILQPASLIGLSIETQTVNVIMPLTERTCHSDCWSSCEWRRDYCGRSFGHGHRWRR